MIAFAKTVLEIILHLDAHINHWVEVFGPWMYLIVFLIILCETGLILTPFLPGDSLVFALGAMTSPLRQSLSFSLLLLLLAGAAILGGIMNYAFGHFVGPKVFLKEKSFWFRKAHLVKTQEFYDRHGGKAVLIARFIPIVRTFVPFVAGIGRMDYRRFFTFNFVGGVFWVGLLLSAGHFFGNLEIVRRNFGLVVPLIIFVSIIPLLWKFIPKIGRKKRATTET